MECIEERIDLRTLDPEGIAESRRITECQFRLNQTMPMTEEYRQLLPAGISEGPGLSGVPFRPGNGRVKAKRYGKAGSDAIRMREPRSPGMKDMKTHRREG